MRTRLLRWSTVITGGILFGGLGGNCLPDNFLAGKFADIIDIVFDTFVTAQVTGALGIV